MLSLVYFILSLTCSSRVLVQAQESYPEDRYTGVQRFLTRPDIECLGWKVTVYDEEALAPGYWFVSPYEINGLMVPNGSWVGPHIYDNTGQLIWSGSGIFDHINVMDFKVVNMGGDEVLSMTYAVKGNAYILNRDYTVNQTIDIGQTQDRYNMHDFGTSDNGSRFLYLKRNISQASAELTRQDLGYDGTCHVTFPEFEERDVKTGEVTHFWDATGIIPLSDSTMAFASVESRCSGGMWDYLHSNAIDKFADGNYIISTRHADTIYKISKDDGSIIWRLHGQGGKRSDFEMINLNFTRQHHVKIHKQNETHTIISFLDNATGADPQPASSRWSRGIFAAINENTMEAELIAHFDHPHQGHAFRRGSMQPLPNGNVFMGWSEQALHTEHTPDGKLLMEAELVERKLGSYRSYKFPLVADPIDPPDVYSNASTSGSQTTTTVYASWNGATKVAGWTVYKTNTNGDTIVPIGAAGRTGFETKIIVDGYAKFIFVQAVDENGKTLGESTVIETMARDVSNEALSDELVWLRSSDSRGWFDKIVANPLATFAGGVVCGVMAILVIRVAAKRGLMGWRSRGGQSYERVSVADTSEYDETRLDDLRPRSYRDKGYMSDDDEGP